MNKRRSFILAFLFLLILQQQITAQQELKKPTTRQDTLRGSIGPERSWWDVTQYDITVSPNYASKYIRGINLLSFKVLSKGSKMQIDLQSPMKISSITYQGRKLEVTDDGNAHYISFNPAPKPGTIKTIRIEFQGTPLEAIHPPWEGGWIWTKDKQGNPWISVACQGLGASVWYPCKDHQSDEPDSAILRMIVPDTLVAVGNGRLRQTVSNADHTKTFTWAVVNPINNYDIIPYIGKYVNFTDTFKGEKGKLDCSYWVLAEDLDKAKKQFPQATQMLQCFEHWFGPYPFYEDSYKLVEAPHLGMEHQSAVAYGNKFGNGYLGRDLSGTGWGLKWDFIIVHESGHEWFGNNITTKDLADMWVHEGFTNYSESLFTECQYGKQAGEDYVIGTRKNIGNQQPIIAAYNVNQEGSGDMYYKGGNMLNMIRQVMNNDSSFRNMLRGLNKTFYHQTVTSAQIEQYIIKFSAVNFSKLFDQYLRNTAIPTLEYRQERNAIMCRFTTCIDGFTLPVKVVVNDKTQWVKASTEWMKVPGSDGATKLTLDRNFYFNIKQS